MASVGLLGWQWLMGPPAVASGTTATVGGLSATVNAAGWQDLDMQHVMDGSGGFMMPDAMMPGAPRGEQMRLGIDLTLLNTNQDQREFTPVDEFTLVGGVSPDPVPLKADTVGDLTRLAPDSAVDCKLYFDILVPEEDDPPLLLQWTRDGQSIRIPVPLTDDAPEEHNH